MFRNPSIPFSSWLVPLWQCFLTRPQQLEADREDAALALLRQGAPANQRQTATQRRFSRSERTTRHYLWLHFCSKECSSHNLTKQKRKKNTAQKIKHTHLQLVAGRAYHFWQKSFQKAIAFARHTHWAAMPVGYIYVYIHTLRLSDAWMNVHEACIGRGESSNRSTVQINRERKGVSIWRHIQTSQVWEEMVQGFSWVYGEGAVFFVAASSSHDGQGTDLK